MDVRVGMTGLDFGMINEKKFTSKSLNKIRNIHHAKYIIKYVDNIVKTIIYIR